MKGLKPGTVGSELTSLHQRPFGSWWPGAQLAETRVLPSGVPVGPRTLFATTISLEHAAGQQEPSEAMRVGAHTLEPALRHWRPGAPGTGAEGHGQ